MDRTPQPQVGRIRDSSSYLEAVPKHTTDFSAATTAARLSSLAAADALTAAASAITAASTAAVEAAVNLEAAAASFRQTLEATTTALAGQPLYSPPVPQEGMQEVKNIGDEREVEVGGQKQMEATTPKTTSVTSAALSPIADPQAATPNRVLRCAGDNNRHKSTGIGSRSRSESFTVMRSPLVAIENTGQ